MVAIADVAHYVTQDLRWTKKRSSAAIVSIFPTASYQCYRRNYPPICAHSNKAWIAPCLAVRMVFDAPGIKRGHAFLRGMMRSAARLTYPQAQAAFDGRPDADVAPVAADLGEGLAAYQSLIKARERRDPLDLDLPERRIVLGADGPLPPSPIAKGWNR